MHRSRASEAMAWLVAGAVACLVPASSEAQIGPELDVFGSVEVEGRVFVQRPIRPGQARWLDPSLAVSPGVEHVPGPSLALRAIGFARWDPTDPYRTFVDLREAMVQIGSGSFVATVGMNTVFWGVTESRHLVDVINQVDFREDLEGDAKLGQLMGLLELEPTGMGLFELYVLTGFRPLPFPDPDSRPGIPLSILDEEHQGGRDRWSPSWAARWSHASGRLDWGLSAFRGTSREPYLVPIQGDEEVVLRPVYPDIGQVGLELQWTGDQWIWKAEGMGRVDGGQRFVAATAGFERTTWGVLGTVYDLGVLVEYSYDGRDDLTYNLHDNDLFGGIRISLNDMGGSEILGGVLVDVETGTTVASAEGSRRFGSSWTVDLTGRLFVSDDVDDPVHWFRRDDHLQIAVGFHF